MLATKLKPELKTPFPNIPETWKDSETGIVVPKWYKSNLEWRGKLLREARKDVILQRDLIAACKQSMLFWINTFVFTYKQHDINELGHTKSRPNPHYPFLTWEIQDQLALEIKRSIDEGNDLGIKKTRQMGASWICAAVFHWFWQFIPESKLLEMSRVREYVDQPGNMKALFQKHDYINRFQPEWLRPNQCMPGQRYRVRMHIENHAIGSVIDGESTTEHAGSGDTRKAILLDEFAKVQNGQAMRSATADVAPCRIVNSTPAGAATEYARWTTSGQIKIFILPFWEHPEKGKGRYVERDENGKYKIRSPWYNEQEKRRSPKEMAQEINMQDIQSGDIFFDTDTIEKHKALFGKKCRRRFKIGLNKDISDEQVGSYIKRKDTKAYWLHRNKKGPLRIWTELKKGRPDQNKTYIFGIDISKGMGASNSVVSIRCRETNMKIAEYADANTPPYEMARIVVALALWCGGRPPRKLPFLKWEMNGPGWDFGRMIVRRYHYPYYYRNIKEGEIRDKQSKKYGWHSSRNEKQQLLDQYNRLLVKGKFINPSIEALDEALYYIYFPDGSIGPANLVEENASARKVHGDRVIADALSAEDKIIKPMRKKLSYPANSIGYRKKKALEKRKKAEKRATKGWQTSFNFNEIKV